MAHIHDYTEVRGCPDTHPERCVGDCAANAEAALLPIKAADVIAAAR